MKTYKVTIRLTIALLLVFFVSLNASTTYAYWANSFVNENKSIANVFKVGEWLFNPELPGFLIPKPENIEEYDEEATYEEGEIVYSDGMIYIKNTRSNDISPPPGASWEYLVANTFIWTSQTGAYQQGNIALYNESLYIRTHGGGSHIPDSGHQAWTIYGPQLQEWNQNIHYGNVLSGRNRYIIYDNNIYKHTNWQEPGEYPTTNNKWTNVNLEEYQIGKSNYTVNSVVIHEGKYYEVANLSRANSNIPGEAYNAWNRIDTLEWQWYNVYGASNRIVYHNGHYFEIISDGNYNDNKEPGTLINAWNRVSSIVYHQYNSYKTGNIVTYNNVAYQAITNSSSITPGTTGSEAYWVEI